MRQLLLEQQISYYKEHGYIEFEDFLTEEEVQFIESETTGTLTKKIGSLLHKEPEVLYVNGKDIYLENSKIKKFCTKKKISNAAKGLSNKQFIRLAFDQVLRFDKDYHPPFALENSYEKISSYQELVCGVLIQFENREEEGFIPSKRGNVTYIDFTKELNLEPLFKKDTKLYLIGYSTLKGQYVHNENDPLTHLLKDRGLTYGDTLQEEFHPSC